MEFALKKNPRKTDGPITGMTMSHVSKYCCFKVFFSAPEFWMSKTFVFREKNTSFSFLFSKCLRLYQYLLEPKRKNGEAAAKKKKSVGGCPFYKQQQLTEYRDRVLVSNFCLYIKVTLKNS